MTGLHLAALHGLPCTCRELLCRFEGSALPGTAISKDNNGCTALSYAAESGHDEVDHNGWGALVFAAHFERRGVVNLFFDSSNVDVDTESLSRALKVATDGGHKEIFNFILDSGSIDVDTESLNSSLSIAARMGHQDVVDLLRSRLDSL